MISLISLVSLISTFCLATLVVRWRLQLVLMDIYVLLSKFLIRPVVEIILNFQIQ